MLSNGLPKKPLWLMKIWDPSESILWMLFSTLMLSTEEVVKSSPPLEESIMVVNLPLPHLSKNPSFWLKLPLPLTVWEESIMFSIKEEVLLSKKNKSKEPPPISLEPTYPSLNLSDSLLPWEELLLDKLSPNVSSHTGHKLPETHYKKEPKLLISLLVLELEKVLNPVSHPSITLSINSD